MWCIIVYGSADELLNGTLISKETEIMTDVPQST